MVDRVGADIGLRCARCGRHVLVERRTVERRILGFVSRGDAALTDAVAPRAATQPSNPIVEEPPSAEASPGSLP